MTKSENLNLAYNQPRHYAVCPTVWLSGLQTNKSDVGDIVFSEEWGEIKKNKNKLLTVFVIYTWGACSNIVCVEILVTNLTLHYRDWQ